MIEVEQLHKRFGRHVAVSNLSFRAPDGAITGLLGANGAGKTTALRMMGGVLRPQYGTIRIDGVSPVEDRCRAQRGLGALLDHAGLYARLTARENLAYFGRMRGLTSPGLERRVEELLQLLGLLPVADRRTAGFSQGERMKVALGRALVHTPSNLLLDEPTNGLDVISIRSLRALLKRSRDEGACIVLSSHMVDELRGLCDRIVLMAGGCVVAEGTADGLCTRAGCESLEEAFVRLTTAAEASIC